MKESKGAREVRSEERMKGELKNVMCDLRTLNLLSVKKKTKKETKTKNVKIDIETLLKCLQSAVIVKGSQLPVPSS